MINYANTTNRWHRFDRIARWPEGLIALGECVCSLNPRYGQGMSVAAVAAQRLHRQLRDARARRDGPSGFASRFLAGLAADLETPWKMATMQDQLWRSHMAGDRLQLGQRLISYSTRRFLDTAFSDLAVYERFMRVAHMLASPSILARLLVAAKVALPFLRRT